MPTFSDPKLNGSKSLGERLRLGFTATLLSTVALTSCGSPGEKDDRIVAGAENPADGEATAVPIGDDEASQAPETTDPIVSYDGSEVLIAYESGEAMQGQLNTKLSQIVNEVVNSGRINDDSYPEVENLTIANNTDAATVSVCDAVRMLGSTLIATRKELDKNGLDAEINLMLSSTVIDERMTATGGYDVTSSIQPYTTDFDGNFTGNRLTGTKTFRVQFEPRKIYANGEPATVMAIIDITQLP